MSEPVAFIAARHRPYNAEMQGIKLCNWCEMAWPCDAATVLAAYDRPASAALDLLAEIDALRAEQAEHREVCHDSNPDAVIAHLHREYDKSAAQVAALEEALEELCEVASPLIRAVRHIRNLARREQRVWVGQHWPSVGTLKRSGVGSELTDHISDRNATISYLAALPPDLVEEICDAFLAERHPGVLSDSEPKEAKHE